MEKALGRGFTAHGELLCPETEMKEGPVSTPAQRNLKVRKRTYTCDYKCYNEVKYSAKSNLYHSWARGRPKALCISPLHQLTG